jgi:hypothetical protein
MRRPFACEVFMRRGFPSLVSCLLVSSLGACAPESPTAFVVGNIKLGADCSTTDAAEAFWASGLYDVSPGAEGACDVPYRMALQVYSFLRQNNDSDLGRAEPNFLRVHSAEVKLMNLQRQPLLFDAEDAPLPNPFLVTTGGIIPPSAASGDPAPGVAFVEVIPVAYAAYLSEFVNDQILAELQLFGTTTGDTDIDFQPFTYPIDICDGCREVCASRLAPAPTAPEGAPTREDLADGECDSNSGSDASYCVDPDC